MLAHFDTTNGRRVGKVMKFNHHTIWVKLMLGAKTYKIIKRHYIKHNVSIRETESGNLTKFRNNFWHSTMNDALNAKRRIIA